MTITVGQQVLTATPRALNGGREIAPAVVTAVDSDGRAALTVFLADGSTTTQVRVSGAADQKAAFAQLEERFAVLPGHTEEGDGKKVPGINSMTGEPWRRSDVAAWEPVCWPVPAPAADAPAPVDAPPPVPVG